MAAITMRRVTKSFGPVHVIKGVDLAIEPNEFVVFVGPSGCGKSTLLRLIAGLEDVTSGDLLIDDEIVNDLPPSERGISMVFQSYALYPHMTVKENMGFGLKLAKTDPVAAEERVQNAARILQIEHLLDRKPKQLSGGQRQRVAIGRAIVRSPRVFLFDEPLSNLDAKLRVEMRTEIKKLHQRLKATIVYVTHDQIEAMTLATRIAVMKAGELLQLGTPKEIYENPADLFVAGFMGSPSMNLIPAKLVGASGGLAVEVARVEGGPARLPLNGGDGAWAAYAGKDVILGVRPEHISDPTNSEAQGPEHHRLDAMVEVTEPTGPDTLAVMLLGGVEATARLRADTKARPGELSTFLVDMGKVCLFDPKSERRIS